MIKITKGDVLESKVDGIKVIVHCCNDINSFGSGVAGNIARKYPHVKQAYHNWCTEPKISHYLGQIQLVKAEQDVYVCNLIGQRDIGGFTIAGKFIPPVRYEAIFEGMLRLKERVESYDANIEVHAPLLGCGLAGGNLHAIYYTVLRAFEDSKVDFTFYSFSDEDWESLQTIHKERLEQDERVKRQPYTDEYWRQNILPL